jgi:diacylglycerol kinase family enzyme
MITFACHHNPGPVARKLHYSLSLPQPTASGYNVSPLDLLPAPSVNSAGYPRGIPTPERVAVLLNANARRVTPSVLRALSRVVARGDLYVSRSPLDARRIAHAVVEQGYHTVFLGGGDGTFVGFADEVLNLASRRRVSHLPHFGILKLGTGNGLANWVNASGGRSGSIVEDVRRARAGDVPGYRALELLCVEGRRAPFASLGVDAQLLNDYVWLKERVSGSWLSRLLTGSRGYAAAVVLRTLPQALVRPLTAQCEIINRGPTAAYRVGPDGQPLEVIAPGELLYKGPAMLTAASTIPYYGYGLRMFPFAGLQPGRMHLRVGVVRPLSVVSNLGRMWRGQWFPEGVQDFLAAGVDVRFDRPVPFQVAGDAAGPRSELTMVVAPERISLVDFSARPALPA